MQFPVRRPPWWLVLWSEQVYIKWRILNFISVVGVASYSNSFVISLGWMQHLGMTARSDTNFTATILSCRINASDQLLTIRLTSPVISLIISSNLHHYTTLLFTYIWKYKLNSPSTFQKFVQFPKGRSGSFANTWKWDINWIRYFQTQVYFTFRDAWFTSSN